MVWYTGHDKSGGLYLNAKRVNTDSIWSGMPSLIRYFPYDKEHHIWTNSEICTCPSKGTYLFLWEFTRDNIENSYRNRLVLISFGCLLLIMIDVNTLHGQIHEITTKKIKWIVRPKFPYGMWPTGVQSDNFNKCWVCLEVKYNMHHEMMFDVKNNKNDTQTMTLWV